MKKTVIVILLILSLLTASSCSAPNTIEVTSKDYPKLTKMSPEAFDEQLYYDAINADYEWKGYGCTLKLEDGKLVLENGNEDLSATKYVHFNHGYLIGAYLWHDGWLRWFSHASSHYPEGQEPIIRLLSKENCRYIIKEDNDNAVIVSVLPTISVGDEYITDGETIIYDFDVIWDADDDDEGYELSLTEVARFAGETRAYFKDGNDFYFVTDQSITKMTPDGKTEVLIRSNIFYQIGVDSIVWFEGELYCGSTLGIYRYNPETGESLWYPMDYENYAK
ncbi:MAG: hypothetical protein IJY97_06800 [Clostridia bacterium]|nr:hypothetical protein [Clostridia bacterium]